MLFKRWERKCTIKRFFSPRIIVRVANTSILIERNEKKELWRGKKNAKRRSSRCTRHCYKNTPSLSTCVQKQSSTTITALSLSLSLSLCLLDFAPEYRHNGQISTIPIRQQRHHLTLKKTTTATKSNQFLIRPSSPFDLPPRFKHAQNKNLRFFALLPILPPPSDPFPVLRRFWRQRHSAAGAVVRGKEQRGGFGSSDGD